MGVTGSGQGLRTSRPGSDASRGSSGGETDGDEGGEGRIASARRMRRGFYQSSRSVVGGIEQRSRRGIFIALSAGTSALGMDAVGVKRDWFEIVATVFVAFRVS